MSLFHAEVAHLVAGDGGAVRRAIYFDSPLDRALGLTEYRLVGDLDRPGYTVERRIERRCWYAPWRTVAHWQPLLVLDVERYTVLRLPSLEQARAWLRREVAQLRTITPGDL